MTPDDTFLQAIIKNPDDSAARLVFADWREEHGQLDMAEYLRVQCELARLPARDERRPLLVARERALLPTFTEQLLSTRFQQFLDEPPNNLIGDAEVRQYGRQHRALPIILEQGGWWAIRMDGEMLGWGWGVPEGPDNPHIEQEPRVRNQLLFEGTDKFGELWLFLPPRPLSSRECPSCHGSGADPQFAESRCLYCGGLKWVP